MDQAKLPYPRLAVDAIDVNAHYEHGAGWHLCIRTRRGDELWTDVDPDLYDRLTTEELADVIECVLRNDLGLGTRS